MKFGQANDPEKIDFKIPPDHPDTAKVLKKTSKSKDLEVYVGCAKWNKKGFIRLMRAEYYVLPRA